MSDSTPKRLVIATRASQLALWQARHVREQLLTLYPDCDVQLLEMTTKGDRILDRTLSKVGGKGLFIKELETALLDGRADLAVHSLKDVPVELSAPFAMPVVMRRDDPRDAFVSNTYEGLHTMPEGSVVGTSSLRREAQVRSRFSHLTVKPLRGNVNTRLRKLDEGQYDAIILAAVGLKRLGLAQRIRSEIPVQDSLPSAGQGALGIEILDNRSELTQWLAPLMCQASADRAWAERAVSRTLGGSCQVPLAAYAEIEGQEISIQGLVAEPDGSVVYRAQAQGDRQQAEALGNQVGQALIAQGARDILERLLPDTFN